jgi:hypothetical protein
MRHDIFEHEERATRVFGLELPRMEATSEERPLVASACGSDDASGYVHLIAYSPFMGLVSHNDSTVP